MFPCNISSQNVTPLFKTLRTGLTPHTQSAPHAPSQHPMHTPSTPCTQSALHAPNQHPMHPVSTPCTQSAPHAHTHSLHSSCVQEVQMFISPDTRCEEPARLPSILVSSGVAASAPHTDTQTHRHTHHTLPRHWHTIHCRPPYRNGRLCRLAQS